MVQMSSAAWRADGSTGESILIDVTPARLISVTIKDGRLGAHYVIMLPGATVYSDIFISQEEEEEEAVISDVDRCTCNV